MNKYTENTESIKNAKIYNAIPKELARVNNTFKYSIVDKDARKIRYETSLDWLLASNMILKCDLAEKNESPLKAFISYDKFKIYLSPFIPLNIDRHNYISTLDLRLIRRIVRDNRTRGKSVSQTIAEWQIVRSGEEKYIFPYVYQADMIINTALAYEIGVLKVYADPLLFSVGVDSIYYSESRRLIDYLQVFFTIPSEYVPKDSVLREFIG